VIWTASSNEDGESSTAERCEIGDESGTTAVIATAETAEEVGADFKSTRDGVNTEYIPRAHKIPRARYKITSKKVSA
jgi:hypothetical protein